MNSSNKGRKVLFLFKTLRLICNIFKKDSDANFTHTISAGLDSRVHQSKCQRIQNSGGQNVVRLRVSKLEHGEKNRITILLRNLQYGYQLTSLSWPQSRNPWIVLMCSCWVHGDYAGVKIVEDLWSFNKRKLPDCFGWETLLYVFWEHILGGPEGSCL